LIIGYTTGVFDLFHVGHLNILKNAKLMCDKLIVGVTTDELVKQKLRKTVIPFEERIEIVCNIRYVDAVVPQENWDKYEAWERYKFDIMFVGDDWFQSPRFKDVEKKLSKKDVKVIYFPYTKGSSSTLINEVLERLRKK
tara:strand:- start:1274 stop:1690 length:417 start_codon:yes stop_codon:yes gene_type:complete